MPNLQRWMMYSPAEIRIRVKIDEAGHPLEAYVLNEVSKDNRLIAELAVDAAKHWVFQPAKIRGKSVRSEHTIVFQFDSRPVR